MRSLLLVASLAASLLVAGCGIGTSSSAPLEPAPTPGPTETPTRIVQVRAGDGDALLILRVYDRSFAVTDARSATAAELADVEPLEGNVVGAYQGVGREVLLTWAGTQCPESGDLFVGPGVEEIVIAPATGPECLKGSSVRGVMLEFKHDVDLAAIGFDLRPRPSA
jgi:hypothetical protein